MPIEHLEPHLGMCEKFLTIIMKGAKNTGVLSFTKAKATIGARDKFGSPHYHGKREYSLRFPAKSLKVTENGVDITFYYSTIFCTIYST